MSRLTVKKNGSNGGRGVRRWTGIDENPFDMFFKGRSSLHREVDRLFEDLLSNGGAPSLLTPWAEAVLSPLVDETEDERAYHIEVELPGMDQDDVDVSYADGILTISGEKKDEKEEKRKRYYRLERSFGAFRREVAIPVAVDDSNIKASFKKGVLNIELPKTKEAQAKPKKINVKSA